MDAKEIKSILKQAREAIKDKEYKVALKHCKKVLNVDKFNYNAWVFVGAAAQEIEQLSQAEEAFQRAIDIAPDQLLAWQGLCNFYEKLGNKEKLYDTMLKMITLLNDDKFKQRDIASKLVDIAKAIGDNRKLIDALELKLHYVEADEIAELEILSEILQEIANEKVSDQKYEILRKTILRKLVQHPKFPEFDSTKFVSFCIKPLCESGSIDKCVEVLEIVSHNVLIKQQCLEFILKSVITNYINGDVILAEDMKALSFLIEGIPSAQDWWIYAYQGLVYYLSNKSASAVEHLQNGLKANPNSLDTMYILCKVQISLHLNKDAENNVKNALRIACKLNSSSNVIGNLYLMLGEALAGKQHWEASFKAYGKCLEYLGRSIEVLKSFCLTLLEVGHLQEAQKIYVELSLALDDPAVLSQLEGYMHILRQENPAALKKLRTSLSFNESPLTLHLIGRVLWLDEDFEKSVKIFAKAAELDPYFSKNFLYLGHYYLRVSSDIKKARQCYQKAFDMDPTNEEIGKALSNLLKDVGENDACIALLKNVTLEAPVGCCKWAWIQLGLHQLALGSINEAIFSLQNALRTDPLSSYIWECLGDAYLKRGSYESALKAFEKSSELNPNAMYPLYQVSTIQKAREMFEDAIARYQKLLDLAPSYIPAQIGLAETLVLLGKKSFDECLFGRAKDCFQQALNVLASVVSNKSSLSCLWKLAGDSCTFASGLGKKWLAIHLPAEFSSYDSIASSKEMLLSVGARCYGHALVLKEDLSGLWHDLGVNYHLQSQIRNGKSKEEVAQKALICLQKAVSLSPNNNRHWTTLGILAVNPEINDFALGQHAFIKSIQIENNNVEAWTNLGALYLSCGNIDLAHQAFQVAQSMDPSYPLCWIGQAVIAHRVKHSETMDLFRHASTLSSHFAVLLGYGREVCKALLDRTNHDTDLYRYNIERMDAIVVATDCLVKYTANDDDCPEAFSILGMLLERQKLFNSALEAYKRALELLQDSDQIVEARVNYARLLSLTGKYADAISEYMKLKKIDTSLLNNFAFVLYKNKEFEKSYQVFNRALDTCCAEDVKNSIRVAMAMVLWKFPSPDINKIQTLLLESSRAKPPSIHGLLALGAIGVLNKNNSLVAAVQKELLPFRYSLKNGSSICLLVATQAYAQNGFSSARSQFLHSIRCQPDDSCIWLQAASSMFQWDTKCADAVARCSQVAVFHGGNKELAAQVFVLSCLAGGYKKSSLAAAQKAVHIHPDKLSNWITVAAACHVCSKDRKDIGWIFTFVKNMAKEQGIKTDVLGWLVIMEVVHNILANDLNAASRLAKQAVSVTSFKADIQSTLQILNAFVEVLNGAKLDGLVLAITANSGSFLGWQLLVQLLLRQEKYVEAEKTLQKFITASIRFFPKLHIYPLLQLGVLCYKAMHILEDKEGWKKIGEKAIYGAIKTFPQNQAAHFVRGLFAIEAGNINLVRGSFEKVVYNPVINEMKWMEHMSAQILISVYTKRKDMDALKKLKDHFPQNEEMQRLLEDIKS